MAVNPYTVRLAAEAAEYVTVLTVQQLSTIYLDSHPNGCMSYDDFPQFIREGRKPRNKVELYRQIAVLAVTCLIKAMEADARKRDAQAAVCEDEDERARVVAVRNREAQITFALEVTRTLLEMNHIKLKKSQASQMKKAFKRMTGKKKTKNETKKDIVLICEGKKPGKWRSVGRWLTCQK